MKKRNSIIAMLVAIIGIAACTKIVSTDIGIGDLIPPVDGVNVKDTVLDVVVNTFNERATTITRINEMNTLGKYADTAFGNTTGSVYVQVQPRSYPFRFPVGKDSITSVDSVVLVLPTYGLYYGDSLQNMGFRVFEVQDLSFDINKGYPYASNQSFIAPDEITYNNAEQLVSPLSVNDTIKTFGDTVGTANQMRIRLKDAVAQKFFALDTANYNNDSIFRTVFNGLKIVSTSGNALVPVYPAGAGIVMYYKYTKKDGTSDTTFTSFTALTSSASANELTISRAGTQLMNYPLGDLAQGSSPVYLQSAPGPYARINIAGLSGLPKMFVYRAELIVDDIPAAAYNPFVPNLFLAGVKDNQRILLSDVYASAIPDPMNMTRLAGYYTSNLTNFGAYPLAKTDTINNLKYYQYNFTLTNHVQNIVKGITPNYPLDIYAPNQDSVYSEALSRNVAVQATTTGSTFRNLNAPGIQRSKVFGNATTSTHRMRLHIVYSPVL